MWRSARAGRAGSLAVGIAAAALALTSCAGGGTADGAESTVTVAVTLQPTSLDPSINVNGGFVALYETLAYESLINVTPDGEYVPGLATEWGYVPGREGYEYEVTIREDALFADGTEVTPEAVADSINYFVSSGAGPTAGAYSGMSAEVNGENTVLLTSETPNPIITELLTPANYGGAIISPAGVADPESLTNATSGAGPYVYQASESVSGDSYVYTPNENYYDPSLIHFDRVIIRVYADTTAAFQAVRSGQAQALSGTAEQVAAAEEAGLNVTGRQVGWNGLFLMDPGGNLDPAFADVRVRQALNYAIDRDAIATAVYGDVGTGTDQPNTPGSDGYDEELVDYYPYDPDRARELLAEAGYADGFEFTLLHPAYQTDNARVMQAVSQQLAEVGVTVTLRGAASISALLDDIGTQQYAVATLNWGSMPEFLLVNQVFGPNALLNLWQYDVPGLQEAVDAYATATDDDRAEAAQGVQAFLVEQALSVPVAQYSSAYITAGNLEGFGLNPSGYPNSPTSWTYSE